MKVLFEETKYNAKEISKMVGDVHTAYIAMD